MHQNLRHTRSKTHVAADPVSRAQARAAEASSGGSGAAWGNRRRDGAGMGAKHSTAHRSTEV